MSRPSIRTDTAVEFAEDVFSWDETPVRDWFSRYFHTAHTVSRFPSTAGETFEVFDEEGCDSFFPPAGSVFA